MSDVQKFKDFFQEADKDKSGFLTMQELGSHLRAKFGPVEANSILEMFNSVDLNNDGKVTMDEFLKALSRRPVTQYSDEELRKAFKELDKSGDGKLDVSEIRSLLERCGKKWSDDNIQKTIKQLDKDGDGKINYNEFLDLLKGK